MDDFASDGSLSHSSADENLNEENKSDGFPVLNLSAIKAEDYLTTQLITRGYHDPSEINLQHITKEEIDELMRQAFSDCMNLEDATVYIDPRGELGQQKLLGQVDTLVAYDEIGVLAE